MQVSTIGEELLSLHINYVLLQVFYLQYTIYYLWYDGRTIVNKQ